MRRPLLRSGLPHPVVSSSSSLPEGRTAEAGTVLYFQPLTRPTPTLLIPRQSSDPAQALQSEVSPWQGPENFEERSGFPHNIAPRLRPCHTHRLSGSRKLSSLT